MSEFAIKMIRDNGVNVEELVNLLIKNAPFLTNIFVPVELSIIAPPMITISLIISCFLCMLVSFFTIRKHLKV